MNLLFGAAHSSPVIVAVVRLASLRSFSFAAPLFALRVCQIGIVHMMCIVKYAVRSDDDIRTGEKKSIRQSITIRCSVQFALIWLSFGYFTFWVSFFRASLSLSLCFPLSFAKSNGTDKWDSAHSRWQAPQSTLAVSLNSTLAKTVEQFNYQLRTIAFFLQNIVLVWYGSNQWNQNINSKLNQFVEPQLSDAWIIHQKLNRQ